MLKKNNYVACNCKAEVVWNRQKDVSLPQFAQWAELHRIDDVQAALGNVTADLLHIL